MSRQSRSEDVLSLREVIGSTVASAAAFDCLPQERRIAYTAGSTVVVATIHEDLSVSRRFFRAHGTTQPAHATSSTFPPDARNRGSVSSRDSIVSTASDRSGWTAEKAKHRAKEVTCVALSTDGKLLAVGEAGHKPRVLIFPITSDPPVHPKQPPSVFSNHKDRVQCVSFSPDSRYLASIGNDQDGYLYIWSLGKLPGLFASGKCTSAITAIAWLGQKLVSVGPTLVRVWRIDEAEAKHSSSLPMKNCQLNALAQETFTSIVAIPSSKQALIATKRGNICLLNVEHDVPSIQRIASVEFSVSALTLTPNGLLHVAGPSGSIATMTLSQLLLNARPKVSTSRGIASARPALKSTTSFDRRQDTVCTIAMAPIGNLLLTVDSKHVMHLLEVGTDGRPSSTAVQQLSAQSGAVKGVRALSNSRNLDASFVTWSADGVVKFWTFDGKEGLSLKVPLEQPHDRREANELRIIKPSADVGYIATGDKLGVLRLIDTTTRETTFCCKAQSNDITDIDISNTDPPLLATSGKTIQVFQHDGSKWGHPQTLRGPTGKVIAVQFTRDGAHILACSSDREVFVFHRIMEAGAGSVAFEFLTTFTHSQKTHLCMALHASRDATFFVSINTPLVLKHNFDPKKTEEDFKHQSDPKKPEDTFKPADVDVHSTVKLHDMVHFTDSQGQGFIAGVSNDDKSVRVYREKGKPMGCDWGQSKHVHGLAMISLGERKSLVTAAEDGTIFIWDLNMKESKAAGHSPRTSLHTASSHKSLHSASSLDANARQLAESMRLFREQLVLPGYDKLSMEVRENLERELLITSNKVGSIFGGAKAPPSASSDASSDSSTDASSLCSSLDDRTAPVSTTVSVE